MITLHIRAPTLKLKFTARVRGLEHNMVAFSPPTSPWWSVSVSVKLKGLRLG